MMIANLVLLVIFVLLAPIESDVLLDASRTVFKTHDGSYIMSLTDIMQTRLTDQLKRVIGVSSIENWNVSVVRDLTDQQLTELVLLAVVGNFTTGNAQGWHQPCAVVLNTQTGLLESVNDDAIANEILYVLIIVFCIFNFKHLLDAS